MGGRLACWVCYFRVVVRFCTFGVRAGFWCLAMGALLNGLGCLRVVVGLFWLGVFG